MDKELVLKLEKEQHTPLALQWGKDLLGEGGGACLAGVERAAGSPEALGEGSLGMSDREICEKERRCWGGRAG